MTPIDNDPATGMNAAIAAELRAERSAQKLTFDDLAERTEISKQTLMRVFNNKRAVTMAYLEAICIELEISMSTIMRRAEMRLLGDVGLAEAPERSTSDDPTPIPNVVSDDELEEALQLPYAARRHVPGPESQDV